MAILRVYAAAAVRVVRLVVGAHLYGDGRKTIDDERQWKYKGKSRRKRARALPPHGRRLPLRDYGPRLRC